ncbi:4-hydroxythreonine-4-phosphate dehydrogenase PdxA [Paracoccaceae bacterium]|nr:4-hydroxythreonine-4-phosphate dehydrogenase PdxA [Paracoccaceae bacterium]
MRNLPIALTCGEPAGIGAELAHKAWQSLRHDINFFWIGDPKNLNQDCPYKVISKPLNARDVISNALPVLEHRFETKASAGYPNATDAQEVVKVIKKAVDLVTDKQASSLCTLPIHKQVLKDGADFHYPGHTEFLAFLSGVEHVAMMLVGPNLKVVPATIHIPLKDVPDALNAADLEQTISITRKALIEQFSIPDPRISIAGLNPHAGESGKFGLEEITIIRPVIDKLQAKHWRVTGPHSADTMFYKAAREKYDVAIAMYHDQALIPIKTLDFDTGVNVTLGLPFVRTSPDHGTALDIAGKSLANPTSTIKALRLAARLSRSE